MEVKTQFSWDDREKSFIPCDYCAVNDVEKFYKNYPIPSVCNNCDYNIILHCLNKGE